MEKHKPLYQVMFFKLFKLIGSVLLGIGNFLGWFVVNILPDALAGDAIYEEERHNEYHSRFGHIDPLHKNIDHKWRNYD